MLYILIIYVISLVIVFSFDKTYKENIEPLKKSKYWVLLLIIEILLAPIIALGIIGFFLEKNTN